MECSARRPFRELAVGGVTMFALAVMMAAFGPAAALDTSKRDFVIFLAFLFLFSFLVGGRGRHIN